ncbi:hypothetical protein C0J52_20350 [Blattella germanica]|nr:hypothetical protein C0J52_20350 [Blattella germanica]
MGMSRLEINLRRLLSQCENMAKEDPQKDWRLEKYIVTLDEMVTDLQKLPKPTLLKKLLQLSYCHMGQQQLLKLLQKKFIKQLPQNIIKNLGISYSKMKKVIEKSSKLADQNFSNLKVESERLEEHSRRACKCWIWVMIAVVLIIFINMVLFMKVMKKRKA